MSDIRSTTPEDETWLKFQNEPYRFLFPLGIGFAAVGTGIWIPYYFLQGTLPYPGQTHPVIQIQGFLLSFIFGFLCTMLPKVLGVAPLGRIQFAIFPLGLSGITLAALLNAPTVAQVLHLLLLLNFILFIATRWPKRNGNAPPTFAFIALGMATDLLGTALRILAEGPASRLGALLQYQAFPLLLILGVGGFLLPKLFGMGTVNPEVMRSFKPPKNAVASSFILGLVFLSSYGMEVYGPYSSGIRLAYAMRAAIWIWFLIRMLSLHRKMPGLPGYLSGARFALFAMGLGLALPVFLPAFRVACEHLIFITGLLWLTLSVAARVLTAHGGRLDILGNHRKQTLAYGLLMVLAAITRAATDVWTNGHWLHLALASAFLISALALWSWIYLPLVSIHPDASGKK